MRDTAFSRFIFWVLAYSPGVVLLLGGRAALHTALNPGDISLLGGVESQVAVYTMVAMIFVLILAALSNSAASPRRAPRGRSWRFHAIIGAVFFALIKASSVGSLVTSAFSEGGLTIVAAFLLAALAWVGDFLLSAATGGFVGALAWAIRRPDKDPLSENVTQ